MFLIVILAVAAGQPVAAIRSVDGFDNRADCESALQAEQGNIADLAYALTQEFGAAVQIRASCVDTTPGHRA